jgi:hypothetical protein
LRREAQRDRAFIGLGEAAMSKANRPFVMTTSWDDGHPLDLQIAQLLSKSGLAGTF